MKRKYPEEALEKPKIKAGEAYLATIEMWPSAYDNNIMELKERFEKDGYLLLRKFLSRERVELARKAILENLLELDFLDITEHDV
jgi:hypothetical protein